MINESRKLMPGRHEHHYSHNSGWLRAAVLGANDGIVSTASLLLGMAAADTSREAVLIAGFAGLVAGAMSMAAGEYVSVSSQADSENADLRREQRELDENHEYETLELAAIYVRRGLTPDLAKEVAAQLMARDALGAHARDEIGITPAGKPRPVQAAFTSAAMFATGAALPLIVAAFSATAWFNATVSGASLATLALLGTFAARAGGAPLFRGAARVTLWGALAMVVTGAVGSFFGTSV